MASQIRSELFQRITSNVRLAVLTFLIVTTVSQDIFAMPARTQNSRARSEIAQQQVQSRRARRPVRAAQHENLSIEAARKKRLSQTKFDFTTNEMYRGLKFKADEIEVLKKELEKANIDIDIRNLEVTEVMEKLIAAVKGSKNLDSSSVSKKQRQQMADTIGEIGHQLFWRILKNRPGEHGISTEAKNVLAVFVEGVSYFEAFRKGEYEKETASNLSALNKPNRRDTGSVLDFFAFNELDAAVHTFRKGSDYTERVAITDSITGKPTRNKWGAKFNYEKDVQNEAGILSSSDLRDGAVSNRFIIAMKGHDIFHSWYLYGHPWAAIAYFKSARSINHTRFAVLGGYFEHVDRVQFQFESQLVEYIDQTLKINREEAMLYLALLPSEKMERLVQQLNLRSDYSFSSIEDEFKNYKPKITKANSPVKFDPEKYMTIEHDGREIELNVEEALSLAAATTYHKLQSGLDAKFNADALYDRDAIEYGGQAAEIAVDAARGKYWGDDHELNVQEEHDYSKIKLNKLPDKFLNN